MTKTDVLKLMELVRSQDPTLVNDLVPAIISTSDLRKIFVNLIREKVSIKDIILYLNVFAIMQDFQKNRIYCRNVCVLLWVVKFA